MTAQPPRPDTTTAIWFKASYSSGDQNCLESARLPHTVPVRDSKVTAGPVLFFTPATWNRFITNLKTDN